MNAKDVIRARAESGRGVALLCVIVLGAAAYSFHLTSFLHAKEAVVWLGACVLAGGALVRGRISFEGVKVFAPLWVFVLAGGVLHLALFKGPVPADTAVEVLRIGGLLLFVALGYDLLTQAPWQRRVLDTVVISAVVVAVLGLLQYAGLARNLFPAFEGYDQRAYSVFGNQDLFGGYMAVAIPVLVRLALARARPRALDLAALAALLGGLLVSGCRSAWLAMAVGVLVALPYGRMSKSSVATLVAACLVVVAGTVLLAHESTLGRVATTFSRDDTGGRLRLWFWAGALAMGRSAPIMGKGLGSFAYWSPRYLGDVLHSGGGHRFAHNELHTIHAHCEPLEIFAEMGLIGVLCGLWLAVKLIRAWRCAQPRPVGVDASSGGLAALVVFALFNAAFHSAPHALAGLLFAGIILAAARHCGEKASRGMAYLLSACALAGAAFFVGAVLVPSVQLAEAENRHSAGAPCLDAYARTVAYPWPNPRAREEYAVALAEAGRYGEAYEHLVAALKGLDTGGIYLVLAGLSARVGQAAEAEGWFMECYRRWPSSLALWELWYDHRAEDKREEIRAQATEWGITIDEQGRAYSTTALSRPKEVMDTEAAAGPAILSR